MSGECLLERLYFTDSGHAGPLEKGYVIVELSDAMKQAMGGSGGKRSRPRGQQSNAGFSRCYKESGVSEGRGNGA